MSLHVSSSVSNTNTTYLNNSCLSASSSGIQRCMQYDTSPSHSARRMSRGPKSIFKIFESCHAIRFAQCPRMYKIIESRLRMRLRNKNAILSDSCRRELPTFGRKTDNERFKNSPFAKVHRREFTRSTGDKKNLLEANKINRRTCNDSKGRGEERESKL